MCLVSVCVRVAKNVAGGAVPQRIQASGDSLRVHGRKKEQKSQAFFYFSLCFLCAAAKGSGWSGNLCCRRRGTHVHVEHDEYLECTVTRRSRHGRG